MQHRASFHGALGGLMAVSVGDAGRVRSGRELPWIRVPARGGRRLRSIPIESALLSDACEYHACGIVRAALVLRDTKPCRNTVTIVWRPRAR